MSRRILVIDDNPAIHEDYRKILCADASAESDLDSAAAMLFGEPTSTAVETDTFQLDSAYQGAEGLALLLLGSRHRKLHIRRPASGSVWGQAPYSAGPLYSSSVT